MKARIPLSAKILLVAALNILVLIAAGAAFVRYELGQEFTSFLLAPGRDRVFAVAREIALELNDTAVGDREAVLARYRSERGVTFILFRNNGVRLAGPPLEIPGAVTQQILGDEYRMDPLGGRPDGRGRGFPPPDRGGRPPRERGGPPPPDRGGPPPGFRGPPPPFEPGPEALGGGMPPIPDTPPFLVTTDGPYRFWVGVRIPIRAQGSPETIPGTLLLASASLLGNPFYFQPLPWLAIAGFTLLLTVACWLPLVRGVMRSVGEMTRATAQIADGRFDVGVATARRDELGSLGQSIQTMSARLKMLVEGQKRFLGDAAHELRSPLARMSLSAGLLERKVDAEAMRHVDDLRDDLEVMTRLTDDLLAFARAELGASAVRLESTSVRDAALLATRREARDADVQVDVDADVRVVAEPDLFVRALANLVRNAVQHAGGAGPIRVRAARDGASVNVSVVDSGAGVPDADLDALFAPFYRPEGARTRSTGGAGLGLAIVRSAAEACGGSVSCRRLSPSGFEVCLRLPAP